MERSVATAAASGAAAAADGAFGDRAEVRLAEAGHLGRGHRRVGELAALLIEEDATTLPPLARQALRVLLAQLQALDDQIANLEAAVIASHRDNEASRRLASIPGVGPITASAIVASVANKAIRTCVACW